MLWVLIAVAALAIAALPLGWAMVRWESHMTEGPQEPAWPAHRRRARDAPPR